MLVSLFPCLICFVYFVLFMFSLLSFPFLISLLGLSNLVDALRTTVQTKVNEGAVKQQVERNEEMIRSALRAIAAAAKIPNIESATKFDEFLRTTIVEGPLAAKYQQTDLF